MKNNKKTTVAFKTQRLNKTALQTVKGGKRVGRGPGSGNG